MASSGEGKYDPETAKTVERNMHVHDLIKAVSETDTANSLLSLVT